MKKVLIVLGVVIVGLALFAGGFISGVRCDVMRLSSSQLDRHISSAVTSVVAIEQLDDGRIEDAKSHLNLSLDGLVLGMDITMDATPDDPNCRTAQRLFYRIARHRKKHPVKQSPEYEKFHNPQVQEMIDQALADALAAIEDEGKQSGRQDE